MDKEEDEGGEEQENHEEDVEEEAASVHGHSTSKQSGHRFCPCRVPRQLVHLALDPRLLQALGGGQPLQRLARLALHLALHHAAH